ncbi:energy transducer TonB [Rhodanobacter sp. 7MK24]|uniref:energy transducer TonB n=1 Tax=Rhodanobacter sp. 7MK24 TaxID=2775922 RepID=UPI001781412D|nr:energy transducer TonB [Rhodanobacter sp. 7MK24]MBD8880270.1 energy transducer TonB [Rhodanobacter sp. 7MK24]
MKKAILGALLAMAVMGTQAATEPAVESSAVVNGTIVLAKDGTVQSAVIDDPAKYGQPIADMVRNAALQWHFQPVLQDGQPVVAKASMHARVVLTQKPDGNYNAHIKGVTFGDNDPNDTSALREGKKIAPTYPLGAVLGHVQGTVYVALQVDRSGHVTQAVAEQVNVGVRASGDVLSRYRETLAQSALMAVRKWTFLPPTTGRLAKQDSWTARVPITYVWKYSKSNSVWQTYVPGPYTPAPWVHKPDANAADALADGGLQTDGAGPAQVPAASDHS